VLALSLALFRSLSRALFLSLSLSRSLSLSLSLSTLRALSTPRALRREADPSFDWWALGCLLYRALGGGPLFRSDDRDNLRDHRELLRLYHWGDGDIEEATREMNHEMAQCKLDRHARLAACDLLAWLLQREPAKRPASCADILAHAFFTKVILLFRDRRLKGVDMTRRAGIAVRPN